MIRNRLLDFKLSRGPTALGICQTDTASAAAIVNAATQRLLFCREANDSGPWGAWAEMAFDVSRAEPVATLSREIARLEAMDVCTQAIQMNNQFFEYLRFGFGRRPNWRRGCGPMQAYDRGTVPTFCSIDPGQIIRVYPGDPADVGKRTLVQGLDSNNQRIYSLDNNILAEGLFATLNLPFVDVALNGATMFFNKVTGLQKDETLAPVTYFQVDPATAEQSQIARLEPSELVSSYRRYYIDHLPNNCCGTDASNTTVQVTALAKLEFIPVKNDTDYLLIGNMEALINECQAVRYSEMDSGSAKQKEEFHHRQAIRFINGELVHYEGKENPAVGIFPFGSARLSRQRIGLLR